MLQPHYHLINKVRASYSKVISNIESNSLNYIIKDQKVNIEGEPIIIEFNKEIKDLKFFIEVITSSRQPFRIWGLPEFLHDDFASISAIDLHSGDKIDIEATKKWLRIYLPKGSCGNIITRLLTNIQHYFDSKTKLYIGSEALNDFGTHKTD